MGGDVAFLHAPIVDQALGVRTRKGEMKKMPVTITSKLTCPECGSVQDAEMPTDSCQFFYDCPSCGSVIRPKQGDCCVFCSYADRQCPSKQEDQSEYRSVQIS